MHTLEPRYANVVVQGSKAHTVDVVCADGQVRLLCHCDYSDGDARVLCAHKIAAALALNARLQANPPSFWQQALAPVRQPAARRPASGQAVLLFSLTRAPEWKVTPYTLAVRHLPEETEYDAPALTAAVVAGRLGQFARQLRGRTDYANLRNLTPESLAALGLVVSAQYYHHGDALDTLLPVLADAPVFMGTAMNPFSAPVTISRERATFALELAPVEHDLQLTASITLHGQPVPGRIELMVLQPAWALAGQTIFPLDAAAEVVRPFLVHPKLDIPASDVEEFFAEYLLPLAAQVPIRGDGLTWEECDCAPVRRLYLSEAQRELRAQLRFGYGDYELPFDPLLPAQGIQRLPGSTALVRITRRPEVEAEAAKSLSSFGLKRDDQPGWFLLRKGTDVVDLLLHQVPRLQQAGFEVYGEDNLTLARVNRAAPTLSLTVTSEIDWFDVRGVVHFGDLTISLKEIRKAMRRQEQYVKLSDGSIGYLPQEWLNRYRHLFGLGEETGDGVRLARTQAMLLDALLGESDQATVDAEFAAYRQRLHTFTQIAEYPLPTGFTGALRHYQQAGYNWLHFLHDYELGGCLADDMGIGKTIQALTLLQAHHESGHTTNADLIVMPRSLLCNWEREAARFTPNLRLYLHSDQDRLQEPELFDNYDVVLTTYGVMLRDLDLLREYRFHYLVLDESQMIKNPQSQTAKAVRMLTGDHRLVLTGTPVENTTVDLWSQFAFLNPGLLGNLEYFRAEFATPIEKKGDEASARLLREMVYPFILRRTKEQVAPELPPCSERILYCEMEPAQRKLYTRERDYYRAQLLGMIDSEGMNGARMQVLEGLLRLRQICNHPRLFDGSFKGESAKFDLLLETLETLRAEGHKALVFSQFTHMLALVREALDARQIPYTYLDGQTKDRQAQVDAFQQDPATPFFLISLRAGGVGLNLTAADYVIHIDPWWNPAVEQQATDRSHRIGQTKPVFVYKLIAGNSVEEKILQLQERKQVLVQQLISSEQSFFKSLTRGDVEVLFS